MATRHAVVFDTDSTFVQLLNDSLGAYGFTVVTAGGQADAAALLQDLKPAVVFIAVENPERAGFTICTRVKKLIASKAPVVLVTSSLTPRDMELHQKQKFRADLYLDKRELEREGFLESIGAVLELGARVSAMPPERKKELATAASTRRSSGGGDQSAEHEAAMAELKMQLEDAQLVARASPFSSEFQALRKELNLKTRQLTSAEEREQDHLARIDETEKRIAELSDTLSETQIALEDARTHQGKLDTDIGSHQQVAERLRSEVEKLRDEIKNGEKALADANTKREEAEARHRVMVDTLTREHEVALSVLEKQHSGVMTAFDAGHRAELDEMRKMQTAALTKAGDDTIRRLAELEKRLDEEKAEAVALAHQDAERQLEQARQELRDEVSQVQSRLKSNEERSRQDQGTLESHYRVRVDKLQSALDATTRDHAREIEELTQRLTRDRESAVKQVEDKLSRAMREENAAHQSAIENLEAQSKRALEDSERKQRQALERAEEQRQQELDALGKKLGQKFDEASSKSEEKHLQRIKEREEAYQAALGELTRTYETRIKSLESEHSTVLDETKRQHIETLKAAESNIRNELSKGSVGQKQLQVVDDAHRAELAAMESKYLRQVRNAEEDFKAQLANQKQENARIAGELQRVIAALAAEERQHVASQKTQDDASGKLERLTAMIETYKAGLKDFEEKYRKLVESYERSRTQLTEAERQRATLETELKNMADALMLERESRHADAAELAKLRQSATSTKQADIKSLEASYQQAVATSGTLNAALQKATDDNQRLDSARRRAELALAEERDARSNAGTLLETATSKLRQLAGMHEAHKSEVGRIRDEYEQQLRALEENHRAFVESIKEENANAVAQVRRLENALKQQQAQPSAPAPSTVDISGASRKGPGRKLVSGDDVAAQLDSMFGSESN